MKAALHDFYNHIAKKKSYWVPVLFFAIIAYAFAITNRTVSVDDLSGDIYWGSGHGMLAGARWGMNLWVSVFSTAAFTPFLKKFMAVCFLICGASVMACVGHVLLKRRNVWLYTVFSSAIITYPLIHEIYEYDAANMIVCGNLLLAAIAILFQITCEGKVWKRTIIAALPLTAIISSYESGIFVYISAVLLYLFCKYVIQREDAGKLQWLREGIGFAIPLVLALLLRIIVGVFLIPLYGLKYAPNGETTLYWGTEPVLYTVFMLLRRIATNYILDGLVYFPITVFLIAALLFLIGIFVLSIRQRRMLPLVLGFAFLASLFFLSILQGRAMPYRTAQTLCLLVAFVAAAAVELGMSLNRRGVRLAVLAAGLLLCLHQGVYLHRMLALNNQRSDNEIAVVHQLGTRLKSEYEDKTVVFVGTYDFGNWITSQVNVDTSTLGGGLYKKLWSRLNPDYTVENKKMAETDVNSILNWNSSAFGNQLMMREYFSYCGYDIQTLDSIRGDNWNEYARLLQTAIDENMKPFEIRDIGDYILVCLGELPSED